MTDQLMILYFIARHIVRDALSAIFRLSKVYQQYPEVLLRQAMSKIRADQMVTVKKHHLAAIKKYGNYMPMSSAQYQLSINYIHKFQTKWSYNVFKECYDVFAKLLRFYAENGKVTPPQEQGAAFSGTEILPVSSGIITIMHDLLALGQIDFDIEMPDQIIMLDARYQGKDEAYFRVAQRYQDILTRLYRFKYESIEAQDAESSELETETQETREDSTKRKRTANDDLEDLEEPAAKVSRMNDGNSERKEEESQQSNAETEKDSGFEHEESTEMNLADHSSRKRPVDVQEDSMDHERPSLKRARLNSEDSMDLEDIEELSLCEDLEDLDKIQNICGPFELAKELTAQDKQQDNEEEGMVTSL